MRTRCTNILNHYFHAHLIRSRAALRITQEEMAGRLMMAPRSYVDLDHGKSGCSALTFGLYLIYVCDDPLLFLGELQISLESALEVVR